MELMSYTITSLCAKLELTDLDKFGFHIQISNLLIEGGGKNKFLRTCFFQPLQLVRSLSWTITRFEMNIHDQNHLVQDNKQYNVPQKSTAQ